MRIRGVRMKKYLPSCLLFMVFEVIAVVLWLIRDNLFYLLNFTYIGGCIALGTAFFAAGKKYARRFVQFAVGSYMLIYLGLISQENMQIEGFWYYLFLGVFEAATIHYAVAKIFGPLLFGRGWCGYACWTAMVLDLLPYKRPGRGEKADRFCALYRVCVCSAPCVCPVPSESRPFGKNHVLAVPRRQCPVLCGWYSSGLFMER